MYVFVIAVCHKCWTDPAASIILPNIHFVHVLSPVFFFLFYPPKIYHSGRMTIIAVCLVD